MKEKEEICVRLRKKRVNSYAQLIGNKAKQMAHNNEKKKKKKSYKTFMVYFM